MDGWMRKKKKKKIKEKYEKYMNENGGKNVIGKIYIRRDFMKHTHILFQTLGFEGRKKI
jgi:hypothetical protein